MANKFKFPKNGTTDRSLVMDLIVSLLQRVRDSKIDLAGACLEEALSEDSFVCSHCGQGGEVRINDENKCCWGCFRRDVSSPAAVAEGICATCNVAAELVLGEPSKKMLCVNCWTHDQWKELKLSKSDPMVSNSH